MRVRRISALHAPLRSGPEVRELVLVTLRRDGLAGHGEAAPLPDYDGITVEAVLAALAREPVALPQARAAVDLAEWDLRGRAAGVPVWRLLGASAPLAVPVNLTVGLGEVAPRARALKVKVAAEGDLTRLRELRDAVGPEVALRLDANGAFTVPQAVAFLREVAPLGIECCEEPVHGAEALAAVAAAVPEVAIAADESFREVLAAERRACAAVCLKVAACGGITGLIADARRAREAGYEVYLASTLDGPLGIAAALHAAAVIRPDRFCGLATLDRFTAPDPIGFAGGAMSPPPGPGLGDGLLGWYSEFGGDDVGAFEVNGVPGPVGHDDAGLGQ